MNLDISELRDNYTIVEGKLLHAKDKPGRGRNYKRAGTTAEWRHKAKGYMWCNHGLSHRVIWAMVYGEQPPTEIDHINGVRTDNRLTNLRGVSRGEQCRNAARRKDTKIVTGVSFSSRAKKFVVQVQVDGARSCKRFDNLLDAIAYNYQERLGNFSDRHGDNWSEAK